MTEQKNQRREIRFDAKFAAVLDQFKATNDVRYYLNGVFVSPHPEKGVILAATDGHTMVIIHDPDGSCDSEQIFPLTKALVAASKKRLKGLGKPEAVELIGDAAFVRSFMHQDFDPEITSNDVYVEHNRAIEGNFPSISKFISEEKPNPCFIAINPSYCARVDKVGKALGYREGTGAVWYTYGENKNVVVDLSIPDDVKIIIMPMRCDIKEEKIFSDSMLSWVKSKEEEKTDV
jgi:DNA polymerase-3 subunit beta